ncbi:MAG: MAE_28990/MAE_18760 family HEPN-like nuclease [Aeromonas veronii]
MSKPFTEDDLSSFFNSELTWRRKELSDLKSAIRNADKHAQSVLLKSIVSMSYAHWEGYIKACANKYFEHLCIRRKSYFEFEQQIYINSFLIRLDALHKSRLNIKDRCKLVTDILDGRNSRFSYINPDLIDTKSNLNSEVMSEICLVCGIDPKHFIDNKTFIDVILLKRRNAIAHGQQESIDARDVDYLISESLSLMETFKGLLENKVYTKSYSATICGSNK